MPAPGNGDGLLRGYVATGQDRAMPRERSASTSTSGSPPYAERPGVRVVASELGAARRPQARGLAYEYRTWLVALEDKNTDPSLIAY